MQCTIVLDEKEALVNATLHAMSGGAIDHGDVIKFISGKVFME